MTSLTRLVRCWVWVGWGPLWEMAIRREGPLPRKMLVLSEAQVVNVEEKMNWRMLL